MKKREGESGGWAWGRLVRDLIGNRGTCGGSGFLDDEESMHPQENPKAVSYRDLSAWKAAMALAVEVYRVVNVAAVRNDFALVDQLRQAAISVPSNIAEGAGRGANQDALRLLYVARGSLGELRTQLEVMQEAGLLDQRICESLLGRAEEAGRLLGGLVRFRASRLEGAAEPDAAGRASAPSSRSTDPRHRT
jgi:four helix bundle protein